MWPLAVITFWEGVRSRVLYGIFLFSLFIMALSFIFVNFFMKDIGKIAVDFNLSAISFAGLLIAVSLSVNLIAKDLEKKTIYFVLSKPISRPCYILGKYAGITLLVLFAYLLLGLLSAITLFLLKSQYGQYFLDFSWMAYLQGIYFDFLKISLLNAVILFFSTFASSSFIVLLFSICTYIVGQSISEVINFLGMDHRSLIINDEIVKYTIDAIKYMLPNFGFFDFKIQAAHGMLANWQDTLLISGYGLFYIGMLLCFATYLFSRKELL